MYKIYADNQIIYDDVNNMDMFRLAEPELDLADNSSGTLTMTLTPANAGYNIINRLTTKITVYRNEVEIWSGRVISEEIDFWKNKKLTCEGELGYLNDTLQPQKEFENPTVQGFLQEIINIHNSKVTADKRFVLGTVTVTDKMVNEDSGSDEYYDDIYVYTNFETTLSCISDKLVNNLGGHIRIRKVNGVRYLDYLKDYVDASNQTIQFGWNLMDFVINYDETNFCTVLIPLGERYNEGDVDGLEGYLDICDVNGGKNYITNQTAVNTFGWIERVEHFDEIDEDTELLAKGREFLSDVQFGTMALEVSAVDLAYYDVNYDEINLLDEVRVKSIPHGLDRMFPVTELKIPLDDPGNSTFTLGVEGITTMSALSNSIVNAVGSASNGEIYINNSPIMSQAQRNAKAIMDTVTTGYITIKRDESKSRSDALYISDNPNYDIAQKRWRWNMGGLAFEERKSDGSYNPRVAITMNGAIVADFVSTGKLMDPNAKNVIFDLDAGALTIKKGLINLGNGNFIVNDSGEVTIKSGSINLGSGAFKVDSNGTLTMTKGSINLANGAFKVDDNGTLTMTKGSINLANGAFKVNSDGTLTMTKGSISLGQKFSVKSDGSLSATNMSASGGTFNNISSDSGTFTNVNIQSGSFGGIDADALIVEGVNLKQHFESIVKDFTDEQGAVNRALLSMITGMEDDNNNDETTLAGKLNARMNRVKNWVRNNFVKFDNDEKTHVTIYDLRITHNAVFEDGYGQNDESKIASRAWVKNWVGQQGFKKS